MSQGPSKNPPVTFFLMVYNQARFLRESIQSAFDQRYDNLEIVLSDDASTDDSAKIILEEAAKYKGPHKLIVNINKNNLCFGHIGKIMEISSGDFVIQAHGDDLFHPDRTTHMVQAWQRHGVSLVTTNATLIDLDNKPIRPWFDPGREYDVSLEAFAKHYSIATGFGAGMGWARELFEAYGPLPPGPRQMDLMFTFWAALSKGNYFIPEPLVYYRDHGNNMSIWAMEQAAQSDAERMAIRERDLCNKVANINRMIEVLEKHLAEHPHDERAASIRAPLYERLQKISLDWTVLRHELALSGSGIL